MILLIAGLILSTLYRDNTERAFDQRLLVYANTLASNLVAPRRPRPGPRPHRRSALRAAAVGLVLAGRRGPMRRPARSAPPNPSSADSCRASPPGRQPASARSAAATAGRPTTATCASSSATSISARTAATSSASPAPPTRSTRRVRDFIFALTVTFALARAGARLHDAAADPLRPAARWPISAARSAPSGAGEAERIAGEYPRDISPLASELNLLLDTNREILERARTQVGNLAHALKTPLSIIMNEAENAPEEVAARVREQATPHARSGQLLSRPRPRRGACRHARHADRGRSR